MYRATSGIAVKTQRVWGSKGYVKEVPSVSMTTPPIATTTMSPRPVAAAGTVDGEGEREEEEEVEGGGREKVGDSPSRPITAVSFSIISLTEEDRVS